MADTNLPDLGEIGPLKSEPAVLNDLSEIKQESIKQESDDNCDSGISSVSVSKDSLKSVTEGQMANDYPEPSVDADGKPRPSINKLPENDKSPFDTASAVTNFDSSNGMPCSGSGEDVPKDLVKSETFEETSTSESNMNGLQQSKLENPTPIKEDDMKSVVDGKDEMACEPTNFDSYNEMKCPDESNQKSKPNGLGQESGEIGSHESVTEEHSIKNSSEHSADADEKPIPPIENPPELAENDKSLFVTASADEKFDSSNGMPCSDKGEDVVDFVQKCETFEETSTSETIMSGLIQSKVETPIPKQEDDMKSAMDGKEEMACEQKNFDSFDEMKCSDETNQDSKPDVSLLDPASESNEQVNSVGSGGGWGEHSPSETKPKLKSDESRQESGDAWGSIGECPSEGGGSSAENTSKSKSNENDPWSSQSGSNDPVKSVGSCGGWGDDSPSETKPKLKSVDSKEESGATGGGWGDLSPSETKPKSKSNESKQESGDAWGSSGGWGDPSPPKIKPQFKSDESKQQSNDAFGSSGGWGDPTPSETKPKFKSDDSKKESGDAWGATGGGWGDPSPSEIKPKAKPYESKQQSDDAWGSSGGWGDPTPSETKPKSNDSKQESGDAWGATGGEWSSGGGSSWADAGSSSKKSGGDDWGASSGTSDWGASSGTSDRGKSGGSGGKGCFKCGEEGHMSRECPKGGGSGSRGKGCFKCGEEGHMSRECPSGGGSGSGSRGKGCFKCGEEGHMSRECPKGGGSSRGGSGRACFKCGEEGHMSRECPSGGGSGSGSRGKGCFKCGEEGHMSRECPNGGREVRDRRAVKSEGAPWGSSGGDWGSDDCAASPAKKNCNWESSSGSTTKTSKEDSWGASGGGWGDPSPSETKPKFKSNDSKQDSSDTWGGGWGDPSPSETKPKSNDSKQEPGDTWGSGGGSSWADSGSSPKKSGGSDWGTSSPGTSDRGKSGGSGGKGCFKCGEEGHMSRECPKGGGSGSRGKGCHRCGKEGHMAKDCSEPSLDADGKPRPPLYKPADLNENDESLFDTASAGENFDSYDAMPCSVSGEDVPKDPERYETFEEAFTSETILNGLKQSKIKKPTPIQKYGMRIVMAGRDLMACAQTGSGKTLAFVLPILQDLFNDKDLRSGYGEMPQKPKALIISPTRELAVQIYREAYKYSRGSIVKVQIIYGGTSTGHQKAKLSEGAHVLVGTAGRLLDFLDKSFYDFSELKYLVLDEADRMIDQGFIPDVRRMIIHPTMPPKEKRQTLMFSATFAPAVQKVAAEFLVPNYLFLTVGILGAANSDVTQTLIKVEKFSKRNKLVEILGQSSNNDRTMIFVESKKTADFLASFLSQSEYKATSIHGDRYQRQREEALDDLKSGKFPILVATSVASRGLDIKDVRHVINYDLPKEIDDYIHRIGRTGRVGNKGKATSFYDPDADKALASKIVEVIESAQQTVPDWLREETSDGQFGNGIEFGGVDYRGEAGTVSYEDLDAPKQESSIDLEW